MEEVLLFDLLGLGVVADEDDVDLVVMLRQKQVEQDKEPLGQVLARFVHRTRDVHHTEHHRLGTGHRYLDPVAVAQIDRIEIGNSTQPCTQSLDLVLEQQDLALGADIPGQRSSAVDRKPGLKLGELAP